MFHVDWKSLKLLLQISLGVHMTYTLTIVAIDVDGNETINSASLEVEGIPSTTTDRAARKWAADLVANYSADGYFRAELTDENGIVI